MSQKTVNIPGIGEVLLAKRRGTRNLRLSIQPNGRIRVGLPAWAPYEAGIRFALSRSDWITKHLQQHRPAVLRDGHLIGKSYRLQFVSIPSAPRISTRLGVRQIVITSSLASSHHSVQKKAIAACERALKKEAQKLLIYRLEQLAKKHRFDYSQAKVKRLATRWGSCSNEKVIVLNYYLIQLPWHLIDYVIIHELTHTVYLNHSPEFWRTVEAILPNAKQHRREIKLYKPTLLPV